MDNCLQLHAAHEGQGWILTAPGSQINIALRDSSETLSQAAEAQAISGMTPKTKGGMPETIRSLMFRLLWSSRMLFSKLNLMTNPKIKNRLIINLINLNI